MSVKKIFLKAPTNDDMWKLKKAGAKLDPDTNLFYMHIQDVYNNDLEDMIYDKNKDSYFIVIGKTPNPNRDKIYLNVLFEEKDKAKENGAFWDPDLKLWYARVDNLNYSHLKLIDYMFQDDRLRFKRIFNTHKQRISLVSHKKHVKLSDRKNIK